MTQPASLFDDVVLLMTLRSVSCEFNAGTMCEAKFDLDGAHGLEGELCIRAAPAAVDLLKPGDVYGLHLRKL